ncbi:MAG: TraR/DksA C4-type zinc finger protein, partial [Planctomycetales bacterium]
MANQAKPCKRCKGDIPAERVEAMPGTELCVKCSQAVGGEFEYLSREVNTAKVGSLKKNYGSLAIRKRRRKWTRKD